MLIVDILVQCFCHMVVHCFDMRMSGNPIAVCFIACAAETVHLQMGQAWYSLCSKWQTWWGPLAHSQTVKKQKQYFGVSSLEAVARENSVSQAAAGHRSSGNQAAMHSQDLFQK